MDPNLIIDDEYVTSVGSNCSRRGRSLEEIIDSYTTILEEIKNEAIMEGEVADALQEYIGCVKIIDNQLSTSSSNIRDLCKNFISEINTADDYLF